MTYKNLRTPAVPPLMQWLGMGVFLLAMQEPAAASQFIPGPADISRVPRSMQHEPRLTAPDESSSISVPATPPSAKVPDAARGVRFTLRKVRIEGSTVFTQKFLEGMYSKHIGENMPLESIWKLANSITERYQNAGYFLSRAYVPQQAITDGVAVIKVVEGYIGHVQLDHPVAKQRVVQQLIGRVMAKKPVTSKAIERFLLSMNDLPGVSFRAVMAQMQNSNAPEGAVALVLETARKENAGSITYDNAGSRFLGPNEVSGTYRASFLPLQQTNISGLSSVPAQEMKFASVSHSIVAAPDVTVQLKGDLALSQPGYTLKNLEIESRSVSVGADVTYQVIRQRRENLSVSAGVSARNTDSDLLNTALTRDKIRTVHAGVQGDLTDRFHGYNTGSAQVVQGVNVLGASDKGDRNLSRAEATPDFTKLEFSGSRLQALKGDWQLYGATSGQVASGPLYSAEEFGYGGRTFGRAYDSSEITGDHGIAGSVEVRYAKWRGLSPVNFIPYTFYDAGMVWNDDAGSPARSFGSSFGFGTRFACEKYAVSGNIALAFPLSRPASSPLYGASDEGARAMLELSKEF